MGAGLIGFSNPGNVAVASPAIWGDCANTILNDRGLGYFFHQDFLGNYSTVGGEVAPGIEILEGGTSVIAAAASGTYGPNVLSAATGASDNNEISLFGAEFGQIIRNSGRKMWFETRIAADALSENAFFVGLTTRAGANTADFISDTAVASGAATTAAVSTIGFISVTASSVLATVNARYTKTTGSPVTVLANVTNATALQNYQAAQNAANPGSVITQAAGVTAQTTAPIDDGISIAYGNLVARSYRKFGVRFDGRHNLDFYVDGTLVAVQDVDSTIDQSAYYVPVVALKTQTAAAFTLLVDFIRMGYQARG